ncbi:hypothetical protein [Pseudocnuella soli]|uniref:hypothetical protein n=1 Tax=Pseudocnuella soli TaxID=2502779 RepID=UPI001052B3B1|nr:hypothetical protein [Pseudocnuella soli]
MKPLLILLTVLSSFFAGATGTPEKVAPAAIRAFETTFSQAQSVSWAVADDLYKVSFQVAGRYAYAYYDEAGNMIAVTRHLSPTELPMVLLAKVKQTYSQYWVSELVEVSNEAGTHYYITLEDAATKMILKSNGATAWSRYQKSDK